MKATIKQINDFYSEYPEYIGKIKTDTRFGKRDIEYADITAYDSPVITLVTKKGKSVSSSPDHHFHDKIDWKKTKDFSVGDEILTVDGIDHVKEIRLENETEDLYDLQIEDVKEYYANGFVSHNSTMVESLSFALFGKPFRKINKPQLINSITQKQLVTEVEFSIGQTEYKIIRGMKPNIFEIYKNGNLLNQSAETKDYQEILEKQIIKVNHKTFCQVVILGSATFQPFMQLTVGQRREIVEDLLDLNIFTTMNSLLKDKIQTNNENILLATSNKKSLEDKIDLVKEHLFEIQNNNEKIIEDRKTRIVDTEQQIEQLSVKFNELKEVCEQLSDKTKGVTSLQKKTEKLSQLKHKIEANLSVLTKELNFFHKYDNCPTCKQQIESEFKKKTVSEKRLEVDKITDGLQKLSDEYKKTNDKINEILEINSKITDNKMEMNRLKTKISSLLDYKNSLEEDINNKAVEETDNRLPEIEAELKKTEKQYYEFVEEKAVLSAASSLLKDGGIKSKIIKQYIPIFNKLINKYLSAMEFMCQFELDEQFNETIKSRYRDEFSYASFSEGEKKKIDLSIMFAWRAVAKMRNSVSTNILIMDEIFDSSLDTNGTEELLKIINNLTSDTNTFIISHKVDQLYDKFDKVIHFEKYKNFSRIVSK